MIENVIPYESAIGKNLAMREFLPDSPQRPAAGIVLIHGLGDYVMRHTQTVEELTELGIAIIGVDLPGHGESEGKRGNVGRLADVHTVIDEARAVLREIVEPVGGKIGALAHSTGGLLLFEYLTRFPGNFAFAWVNACLVDPLHRRSSTTAPLAKVASLVAPSLTLSTKVVPSMSKAGEPDQHPPPEAGRGHDRVSVRFGLELIRAQQRIAEFHTNLNRDFRLLMTHGGQDEVCPIKYAREFYSMLTIGKKEFREFPQHLHHLLHDPVVMDFGKDWLRRVLAPAHIVRRV
jgi:alpha-beta hydrolase superfamily lysophospholipase